MTETHEEVFKQIEYLDKAIQDVYNLLNNGEFRGRMFTDLKNSKINELIRARVELGIVVGKTQPLEPKDLDINTIYARTSNGAFGLEKDGVHRLPWERSSEDMKHFERTTMGSAVIMGRRTFESLNKTELKGRLNIVVSGNLSATFLTRGIVFQRFSLEDALRFAGELRFKKVFVIGGVGLIKESLPLASRVYETVFHEEPEITKDVACIDLDLQDHAGFQLKDAKEFDRGVFNVFECIQNR